jgi:two-component system phosphate regulon response regulator PhoB
VSAKRILVVEDEEDLLELVEYNLRKAGHRVLAVTTGEAGLLAARAERPDLVLLDLMLPGVDGFQVCRLLRRDAATRDVPIVMLTARGEDADVVKGLELGADDYVTKPFSPKVLLARVAAVLRRKAAGKPDQDAVLTIDGLVVDPRRHGVTLDGQPITLTNTEFRILHFLASRRGWAFTRAQIVDAVRGPDHPVTDRSVDVHVFGLRRKLGPCRDRIETVRGVGYRFSE